MQPNLLALDLEPDDYKRYKEIALSTGKRTGDMRQPAEEVRYEESGGRTRPVRVLAIGEKECRGFKCPDCHNDITVVPCRVCRHRRMKERRNGDVRWQRHAEQQ